MNKYEIELTCCCGAEIKISSTSELWSAYRYREFLEAHKDCNNEISKSKQSIEDALK